MSFLSGLDIDLFSSDNSRGGECVEHKLNVKKALLCILEYVLLAVLSHKIGCKLCFDQFFIRSVHISK